MIVREALNYVSDSFTQSDLFYGHGIESAWDEAVALVLTALTLPVDSGDEVLTHSVSDAEWARIVDWTKARVEKRMPLAYIIRQAWFMGLPFYVDQRVLIPRSPFAEWIERGFQPWVNPDNVLRILEIGTGSGCMAIAAAYIFSNAHIDAVDISKEALAVAAHNVSLHHFSDRIHLLASNCFDAISPMHQYDLIISNPPYVSREEINGLPKEYLHEPVEQALYAEEEGLAIVTRLLAESSSYLTQAGVLVIEVGYSDDLVRARYPAMPFMWLDCEHGGQGLFLLTRKQLEAAYGRK